MTRVAQCVVCCRRQVAVAPPEGWQALDLCAECRKPIANALLRGTSAGIMVAAALARAASLEAGPLPILIDPRPPIDADDPLETMNAFLEACEEGKGREDMSDKSEQLYRENWLRREATKQTVHPDGATVTVHGERFIDILKDPPDHEAYDLVIEQVREGSDVTTIRVPLALAPSLISAIEKVARDLREERDEFTARAKNREG